MPSKNTMGVTERPQSHQHQVELVAERRGIDPLEVGVSKLKGLTLANISTVHKEEGLSWHKFRQHLIEQYSNVPHVPDAMFAYS